MRAGRPYHTPLRNARQHHLRPWAACIVVLGVAAALGTLGPWPLSTWWTQSAPVVPASRATFPSVVLWAWERPEALDFIDVQGIGIAFLARTLYLTGSDVIIRPRLQPFSAPPDTQLMAVVRIASDRWRPPDLSRHSGSWPPRPSLRSARSRNQALQVDFDATVSQRAFYRGVLHQLRRQLSASMPLSITALASWCIFDNWLAGLPVDEVVADGISHGSRPTSRPTLPRRRRFRAAACRHSLGISTDEPRPTLTARAASLRVSSARMAIGSHDRYPGGARAMAIRT
jgi:hypothetical protein